MHAVRFPHATSKLNLSTPYLVRPHPWKRKGRPEKIAEITHFSPWAINFVIETLHQLRYNDTGGVILNRRDMNFIRATARGILEAMDAMKENPESAIIAALTEMTTDPERPLRSREVGYYAVMYLAAHDWEIPDK